MVRRTAGERGGVELPFVCKEFKDVRLCNVGVIDRSLLPSDPELGALRRGFLKALFLLAGEGLSHQFVVSIGGPAGEDGGRAVAAAVERDVRFILFERDTPSLFIDLDMFV